MIIVHVTICIFHITQTDPIGGSEGVVYYAGKSIVGNGDVVLGASIDSISRYGSTAIVGKGVGAIFANLYILIIKRKWGSSIVEAPKTYA
jgi:hypothetical protein